MKTRPELGEGTEGMGDTAAQHQLHGRRPPCLWLRLGSVRPAALTAPPCRQEGLLAVGGCAGPWGGGSQGKWKGTMPLSGRPQGVAFCPQESLWLWQLCCPPGPSAPSSSSPLLAPPSCPVLGAAAAGRMGRGGGGTCQPSPEFPARPQGGLERGTSLPHSTPRLHPTT